MRVRVALCLLGLGAAAAAGCELYATAVRNIAYDCMLASGTSAEYVRNCQLAKEKWNEIAAACAEGTYSKDYAQGFKDGFVDYIRGGGSGDPPPVPPDHYRCACYHTPEGRKAVDDWFGGFRHGAAAAKESGRRELAMTPVVIAPPPPCHPDVPPPDHPPAPPLEAAPIVVPFLSSQPPAKGMMLGTPDPLPDPSLDNGEAPKPLPEKVGLPKLLDRE